MTPGKFPDDTELQSLYREATAQDAPDIALDNRILGAAKKAAASRQQVAKRPAAAWWKSWLIPVSVTAVAVLGVSLTLRVHEEQAALESARLASEPAPTRDAPAGAPVTNTPTSKDDRPPALAEKSVAKAKRSEAIPESATPARVQPSAPESAMQAPMRDESRAAPAAAMTMSPASAPPAMPAAVAAEAVAAAAAAASRPAPARAAMGLSAPSAAPIGSRQDTAGSGPDSLARMEAAPERWLEHIRSLRRQGQDAESTRQLARFRQRYPGYPLPSDLK